MTLSDYIDLYQKALDIAEFAHRYQKRKVTGSPYIEHVRDVDRRVSERFSEYWNNEDNGELGRMIHYYSLKIVATLHDVMEDHPDHYDMDTFLNKDFPIEIVDALVFLNFKRDKRSYNDKVMVLRGPTLSHKYARFVKICDNLSNLSDHPSDKQIWKYTTSLRLLLYDDSKSIQREVH